MAKLLFTEFLQCGAMYNPARTCDIDVSDDYESALVALGYKKLGNGVWSKRTAYNMIEIIKVK